MKLSTLCAGAGLSVFPEQDVEISGITDSSEKVRPGNLFVCVRGRRSDGHRFAAEAVQKGAAAVLAEAVLSLPVPVLYTTDSRRMFALLCAALAENPARSLRLTGITGTNGKTTVSWILWQLLQKNGRKAGLTGTVENRADCFSEPAVSTTPDPPEWQRLLGWMKEKGCTEGVAEISSQALDQHRVDGIRFRCAAFTNLTEDHLDYHESMEDYYQAKRKLFSACECAVINADDPWGMRLSREISCRKERFSISCPFTEYGAESPLLDGGGTDFTVRTRYGRIPARMPLFGAYNLSNSLCALLCAAEHEVPLRRAIDALEQIEPPRGRMEELSAGDGVRVFIDYAHTPDALEKALRALRGQCGGRLLCLFGCGGDRDRKKRPQMGRVASENSDFLIVTSDNPRTETPGQIIREILPGILPRTSYRVIENRAEAIGEAVAQARAGDILLIAGKGHETVQIIGNEAYPFDEKQLVQTAWEKRRKKNQADDQSSVF